MKAMSSRSSRRPDRRSPELLSSSTKETSGRVARNSRMARATRGWNGADVVKPTAMRPVSPRAVRRARAAARSTAARIASASGRKERPASVSATPRGWRTNSGAWISASSALICCDSGGCWIWSFSAARVMWPSWATATK